MDEDELKNLLRDRYSKCLDKDKLSNEDLESLVSYDARYIFNYNKIKLNKSRTTVLVLITIVIMLLFSTCGIKAQDFRDTQIAKN